MPATEETVLPETILFSSRHRDKVTTFCMITAVDDLRVM